MMKIQGIELGLHGWVSSEKYHTGPGVSNTDLKMMWTDAPAKVKQRKDNPKPPTDAMNKGQLFHTMVLEPHKVLDRFAIIPASNNTRTNEGKRVIEELHKTGKIVIKESWADDVLGMVKSVNEHPFASTMLNNPVAKYEQSIYWQDPVTKILCKCRPDIMVDGLETSLGKLRALVDLKKVSGEDSGGHWKKFQKSIINYFYHQQGAFYLEGANRTLGGDWDVFIFIAVEDTDPYLVSCYFLDAEFLEEGRKLFRRNLNEYAKCLESGIWPGYGDGLREIEILPWGLSGL